MRAFPERITIELTNDCNLSCPMCPRQYMQGPVGYMKGALWQRLIDECERQRMVLVPFWRGESLLHPEFEKMIEYALGRVSEIQFATNGYLINENNIPLLNQFDFLSISIHDRTAVERLRVLLHYRNNHKPVIQASFVESEKSMEWMEAVRSMVDYVRIYKNHTLRGVFGKSDGLPGERSICPKLLRDLVIAYDGSVSRCCYVMETDKTLDVTRQSIAEVWNSPIYQQILKDYPDAICGQCDQWRGETLGERYSQSVA